MFEDDARELGPVRLQDFANHIGVLIDDRRVRADVDDTVHTPFRRVVQSEAQAGQRLASTGGDSQEIGPFRTNSGGQTGFRNLPSKVDRKSTRLNSSHRCISYAV